MKRVFFDTSVLVSALIAGHSRHANTFPFLTKVRDKHIDGGMATHTLAELYHVLTAFPVKPPLTPGAVLHMLEVNLLPFFSIVSLSSADYRHALSRSAAQSRRGGSIYDALLLEAARKFKAEEIVTLNKKHFSGYDPDLDSLIHEP